MKRRGPRGLNPDEKDLWERVAKTATPLEGRSPSGFITRPGDGKTPPAPKKKPLENKPIKPFSVGSRAAPAKSAHKVAPTIGATLDAAPLRMDQKAFGRMKRGKTKPEGRIDLHGMHLQEAHGALNAFIHSAQASGKRLVLVITGKGRISDDTGPIPVRTGILRHQVPDWLSRPPLSALVLQVTEAHQKHGGSGAFYVYLRRR